MHVWYNSQARFIKKIERSWIKRNFNYNSGNLNILKYSYRTLQYWENIKSQKVSKANKIETSLKLF